MWVLSAGVLKKSPPWSDVQSRLRILGPETSQLERGKAAFCSLLAPSSSLLLFIEHLLCARPTVAAGMMILAHTRAAFMMCKVPLKGLCVGQCTSSPDDVGTIAAPVSHMREQAQRKRVTYPKFAAGKWYICELDPSSVVPELGS